MKLLIFSICANIILAALTLKNAFEMQDMHAQVVETLNMYKEIEMYDVSFEACLKDYADREAGCSACVNYFSEKKIGTRVKYRLYNSLVLQYCPKTRLRVGGTW